MALGSQPRSRRMRHASTLFFCAQKCSTENFIVSSVSFCAPPGPDAVRSSPHSLGASAAAHEKVREGGGEEEDKDGDDEERERERERKETTQGRESTLTSAPLAMRSWRMVVSLCMAAQWIGLCPFCNPTHFNPNPAPDCVPEEHSRPSFPDSATRKSPLKHIKRKSRRAQIIASRPRGRSALAADLVARVR
eukprot:755930-Rhodomonas_salina.1